MKKKSLCILLVLAIVLMTATVIPGCAGTAAPAGTAITRKQFSSGTFTISEDGSYYLKSDVTGNLTVASGVTATLDLNGYVLQASGEAGNTGVIMIEDESSEGAGDAASLVIQDSANESAAAHCFAVNGEGMWVLQDTAPTTIHYDFANGILTKHNETTATADIPAEGEVIQITGGCITGGCITGGFTSGREGNGGGIYNGGTLSLKGGTVTGNKAWSGGGVYNYNERQFTLDGGSIVGNHATREGGGFFNDQGTSTLRSGSISYNSAYNNKDGDDYGCGGGIASSYKDLDDPKIDESTVAVTIEKDVTISHNYAYYGGGGIYFCYGSVTLNGAVITDNSAINGGGVRLYAAENQPEFTMNSGEITGNKAIIYGGFGMNGGSANLLGGTISGNTFTSTEGTYGVDFCGAGVVLMQGTLNVGGAMQIYDNTYDNGIQDNLFLLEGQAVTISTENAPVSGENGMKIGIKMQVPGSFTTNGTGEDAQYFTSDDSGYSVEVSEGCLMLAELG